MKFFVARYIPNILRNEPINVGILLPPPDEEGEWLFKYLPDSDRRIRSVYTFLAYQRYWAHDIPESVTDANKIRFANYSTEAREIHRIPSPETPAETSDLQVRNKWLEFLYNTLVAPDQTHLTVAGAIEHKDVADGTKYIEIRKDCWPGFSVHKQWRFRIVGNNKKHRYFEQRMSFDGDALPTEWTEGRLDPTIINTECSLIPKENNE